MPTPEKKIRRSFGEFLTDLKNYFVHLIDLREDTDKEGTIESIKKYIQIRGYNVWILISAAMIASIGLDNNAPAVIIGAMLISPLMSPILGIGLAIGINDRNTLWLSIQNFMIAIIASILASFIYFTITPLGIPTEELLSRTRPTLLDVAVAFFGGIAGIVAGSRKDKTNAIPGVAIATALMPPLCTVGFGLAKGNVAIWAGALYLFFINAVIIAVTTYILVRFLNFPLKEYIDPAEKRKTSLFITVFVGLMVIPSVLILLSTLRRISTEINVKSFIETHVNDDKREAMRWKLSDADSTKHLKIYLVGQSLSNDTIPILEKSLHNYTNLEEVSISLVQTDVSLKDITNMTSQANSQLTAEITQEVMQIIEVNKQLQDRRLNELEQLKEKIYHLESDSLPQIALEKELKAMYPEINTISIGKVNTTKAVNDSTNIQEKIPTVFLTWGKQIKAKDITSYEKRIISYLQARLKEDKVIVKQN